jgi:hypothetical protein
LRPHGRASSGRAPRPLADCGPRRHAVGPARATRNPVMAFRTSALLAVTASLLLSSPASARLGEINAKPGGKVKVIHGTPSWRESFEDQMKPGLNWRLGSNAATTLESEGGLVFANGVLFPGEYNLALSCNQPGAYELVVHQDGTYWKGEAALARIAMNAERVDEKKGSKALAIEFEKDKGAPKGGYLVAVLFGPHRLTAPFIGAKAKSASSKAGKQTFKTTWLERTDLEELQKKVEGTEEQIARLEPKAGKPYKVFLRGGPKVQLRLEPEDGSAVGETLEGQSQPAAKPAPALTLAFQTKAENSVLTVSLGENTYVFDLAPELFAKL